MPSLLLALVFDGRGDELLLPPLRLLRLLLEYDRLLRGEPLRDDELFLCVILPVGFFSCWTTFSLHPFDDSSGVSPRLRFAGGDLFLRESLLSERDLEREREEKEDEREDILLPLELELELLLRPRARRDLPLPLRLLLEYDDEENDLDE